MSARSPKIRSWLQAVFGILMVGAAFFSRTDAQYEPIRLKVVREAIDVRDHAASVMLPDSPRLGSLRAPVLVIRARSERPAAAPVTVSINGARVGAFTMKGGETARADLVLPPAIRPRTGDTITVDCACAPWRLEYLEIGNVHGSSNAFLKFLVVPAEFSPQTPAWWIGLSLMAGVCVLALCERPASRPRAAWRAVRVLQGIFAAFLALVLIAPMVSAFMLVISLRTLVLCAVVLSLGGAAGALQAVRRNATRRLGWRPAFVDTGLVALAVALFCGSALSAMLEPYAGNASGLLVIDREKAERFPPLSEMPGEKKALFLHDNTGYDGQFFYFMAFDPLLRAYAAAPDRYGAFIDAPPYRYGRIGFSLLTRVFAAGLPRQYPVTMVALVTVATVVGAVCLAGIFAHYGRAPAWALMYMLVPGFILSMQVTLPEPIAAAALLGGYWCWLRGRLWPAAALFAFSLLVRETSAILLLALIGWEAVRPGRRAAAAVLAAALLPLALWRAYVCWALWPVWGWEGLFFNPHNMGLPFVGLYTLLAKDLSAPGVAYPAILCAGLGLAVAYAWARRDALSAALLAYAVIAVSLNYSAIWVAVGNGERGTYEVCLLPMVAFAGLDQRHGGLHTASLAFFGGLAAYQLFGATSFSVFRMALGL